MESLNFERVAGVDKANSKQNFALETPSSPPPTKRKSAFETPSPPSKKKFALETPSPPPLRRRPVSDDSQLFSWSAEEAAATKELYDDFQKDLYDDDFQTPPSKQKFSLQTPSPPPLRRRRPVSQFSFFGSVEEEAAAAAAFKELYDDFLLDDSKSKHKFAPETPSTPPSKHKFAPVEEVAAFKEMFEQLQAKPNKGWD